MEEAMAIRNYLKNSTGLRKISEEDRSYAIQKIFELHLKKGYRKETLFVACSIFDRYLIAVGWQSYPREKICLLATTSILVAAKLEQSI
jgi:hypothetical protein